MGNDSNFECVSVERVKAHPAQASQLVNSVKVTRENPQKKERKSEGFTTVTVCLHDHRNNAARRLKH